MNERLVKNMLKTQKLKIDEDATMRIDAMNITSMRYVFSLMFHDVSNAARWLYCLGVAVLSCLPISVNGEDLADWVYMCTPRPNSIVLKGEPCANVVDGKEKHFLVAGSNATIKVSIKGFCPDWEQYVTDKGDSGYVRHTLQKIIVTGYAAAEFNDKEPPPYPSMSEDLDRFLEQLEEYSHGLSESYCGKLFREDATGRRLYTTPATMDLSFVCKFNLADQTRKGKSYSISSVEVCAGDKKVFKEIEDGVFESGYPHHSFVPQELYAGENTGEIGEDHVAVFEFPVVFPTGRGFHGAYYWTASMVYTREFDGSTEDDVCTFPHMEDYGQIGNGLRVTLLETNDVGWVFFDKYGQDNAGVSNWFTYWGEDGACPGLYKLQKQNLMHNGIMHKAACYDANCESIYGGWYPTDNTVHFSPMRRDENGNELGPAGIHYPKGYTFSNKNSGLTFSFGGVSDDFKQYTGTNFIYGIYTVEEVVAHELQHRRTVHDIYPIFCTRGDEDRADSDRGKIPDDPVGHPIDKRSKAKDYNDYLYDIQEKHAFRKYDFDIHDTDTYGIGLQKDKTYFTYGDNEFLSMMDAAIATMNKSAVPENDWAYPGARTYIPGIKTPKRRSEVSGSSNSLMLNPLTGGSTQENTMPVEVTGIKISIERAASYAPVSSLIYALQISNSSNRETLLHCSLVGVDGALVATACAIAPDGDGVVELRFNGQAIYESGCEGPYAIGSVAIMEYNGNEAFEIARLSEFADTEVDLRREDFARNDAYLLGVEDEMITTNGVVVTVDVEVHAAGEYEISATLANTGGVHVASGSIITNCVQGTNRIGVVFAAREIFQSRVDGPYAIDNITLYKGGKCVDSRLDFCVLRKIYQNSAFMKLIYGEDENFDPVDFMAQFEDYTPPSEIPPPEKFFVFFNPNEGTVSEIIREVICGEKVGTLPIPTLEDDEFLGWYTELDGGVMISDATVITTNMMYHAHWKNGVIVTPVSTQQTWTVTFNANGGSLGGKSSLRASVPDNAAIGELSTPTRKGYKFLGWYTAKSGGTKVTAATVVTGNMTVYARWAAACTVTWNANGGKIGSAKTSKVLVRKGKAVGTLPKATRKGYKFKGWYTKKSGGTKIKTTTKVTKNVTYYARWTANKYKIKFNKNGGKGTMKVQSATYGKTVTLRANTFKRAKYKFAGWAKTKKGKVAYKNKAKVKNLTTVNGKTVILYAVWKKAKSGDVKASAGVAKSAATVAAAVPKWAVGTFYGGDEGTATTITVSKAGKVSGKVVFADGRWTIVGRANGQRIEATVTDADGDSVEVVFAIVKTPDGRCRIESEDGSIWVE